MGYISELRKYIGSKPIFNIGATIIVMNDNNEILLNLRSDTNTWGIIGGSVEIGESLEEKPKYKTVLKKEILEGFEGITDFSNIVIAYEPIWAIGTGEVATTSDISKVHGYIKKLMKENYNTDALVLYGGSVKPSNSKEILELAEVDGVLIGGASLKATDYVAIASSR